MVRTRHAHLRIRLLVLTAFVWVILGIVVMLFFKCIVALFSPVYRRGDPIKWGVATYTAVIFSFVTVLTTTNLYILSISYIDNREFPGVHDVVSPGPYGYQCSISPEALAIIPNVMFALSNWLADGLLVGSSLFDIAPAHPYV